MTRADKLRLHAIATLQRANCDASCYTLTVAHDDYNSVVRCMNAAGVTWWLHYVWRDGDAVLYDWEVFGLFPTTGRKATDANN